MTTQEQTQDPGEQKRRSLYMDEELWQQVREYRHRARLETISEAIRELVLVGLEQEAKR